jgi:HK97 family phage portal protein
MSLFTDAVSSLRAPGQARPRAAGYSWTLPSIRAGRIDLVAELTASYAQIYEQQPWVHAAINKHARTVGMLPLKAYQREGPARERMYEGELHRLTKRPFGAGTPSYWKQHGIGSTILWGNGIYVKLGAETPEDIPDEIFPAPAIGWSLGENETYVWTDPDTGNQYPFERWKIIHLKHWSPQQNGFGVSALEPLRRTLAIEDAATRLGVAAFKNAVAPASVFTTDQTLDDTILKRLRGNIENLYGNVDKAFRVAILEKGLKWEPFRHNLNDAAVLDHRKLTREEVAAVIDVPQPNIGILENANFASLRELHLMLYQDSLGPPLKMFEETIMTEFVSMIPEFEDQYVEFDLGAILRGDITTRSIAYQRLTSAGIYTSNELRPYENLPPSDDPEADKLHFPSNLSPNAAVDGATDQGNGGQSE